MVQVRSALDWTRENCANFLDAQGGRMAFCSSGKNPAANRSLFLPHSHMRYKGMTPSHCGGKNESSYGPGSIAGSGSVGADADYSGKVGLARDRRATSVETFDGAMVHQRSAGASGRRGSSRLS